MSSPLPKSLRMAVLNDARSRNGLVRCAGCGRTFGDSEIEVDHIHPESLGGGHDRVNLQALCAPKAGAGCHRLKSRQEAKARSAATKAPRSPFRIDIATILAVVGVAFVSTAFGVEIVTLLRLITVALLGALALGIVWALFHIEDWVVPDGSERTEAPKIESSSLAPKMRTALVPLLGEEIVATSVRVGYSEHVEVRYSDRFADHDEAKRIEVLERVNAKMGGRWRAEWQQSQNLVIFSPVPKFPKMIRHPGLPDDQPWQVVPIAPDVEIDLRLASHALIIGATNMGKTSIIRSVAIAAIHAAEHHGVETILADPKRIELVGFAGWPGVTDVTTEDEDLWNLPIDLKAEMDTRAANVRDRKVALPDLPPIICVIDEYEEYVRRMTAYWSEIDPETKKPRKKTGERVPEPVRAMASLLAMSRRLKIHVFIGTQRPDASWFGGAARDNLQFRIGVGPLSPEALRMAYARSDVGRDLPKDAKGRFTYQSMDNDILETQAYWVPDPADFDGTNSAEDWRHLAMLRGQ